MTDEVKIQWCETCQRPADEVHVLRIFELKGKRYVCTKCLRSLRKALPDTKLVQWGREAFQAYWEVKIALPSRRRPCVQAYEMTLAPWQAGLLRLAGFRIEEVV